MSAGNGPYLRIFFHIGPKDEVLFHGPGAWPLSDMQSVGRGATTCTNWTQPCWQSATTATKAMNDDERKRRPCGLSGASRVSVGFARTLEWLRLCFPFGKHGVQQIDSMTAMTRKTEKEKWWGL